MYTDIALFILRVVTGLALLTHGWGKITGFKGTMKWLHGEGFPLPLISTCLVILAEFFGATLLILGIFVPYVATFIAANFIIVIFYHLRKKHGWKVMEIAVLYFVAALTLALAGAGAWALL